VLTETAKHVNHGSLDVERAEVAQASNGVLHIINIWDGL
jgi:hypothetical protein